MAVKMRLRREGKKKQPYYRVVVADGRSPRDGRFIEDLGYYHPLAEPSAISIDHERALHWLNEGVQPTQAVTNLLRISGVWEAFRPGQPDPNAERRAKRAAKREQQAAKLAAAEERSAAQAKQAAEAREAAAAERKAAAEAPATAASEDASAEATTDEAQADAADGEGGES